VAAGRAPRLAAESARSPDGFARLPGTSKSEANPRSHEPQVSPARWRPASRAALKVRAHDLYETPRCAVRALLRTGEIRGAIWEPCAGRGAIVRELRAAGFQAVAYDLVAHEGADPGIQTPIDFLLDRAPPAGVDIIITNPPYKLADDFIRHGLSLGLPFVALLRLMALEGSGRSDLMDRHLRRVWAGIERLSMMHREGWQGPRTASGGAPFAWFAFEPGQRVGPIELNRISWREPAPDQPATRRGMSAAPLGGAKQ
jgi:hypothetical protein